MANYVIKFDNMVEDTPIYARITVDNDDVAGKVAWQMSKAPGLSEGNYDIYREVAPAYTPSLTMTGSEWVDKLNDSGFCREDMEDIFCNHENEPFTSREVVDMVTRYEGGVYAHTIYKLMEACYDLYF